MAIHKITDLRVSLIFSKRRALNSPAELLPGPYFYVARAGGGSGPYGFPGPPSAARIAIMLEVFNLGRDCYWDDVGNWFLTNAGASVAQPVGKAGQVGHWDIQVPFEGPIVFFVSFVAAEVSTRTSGSQAAGWATLQVNEDVAAVVLALLKSRYPFFDNGDLRNTDILDSGMPEPVTQWEPTILPYASTDVLPFTSV